MKTVILLRHAKSSWTDGASEDHDRVLNARGRRAAPATAGWLAARQYLPDTILCSSAARTRETFTRMAETLPALPAPSVEPGLYHASPSELLDRLARLPATCKSVMVIGHQPGLGGLARRLSGGDVRPRCRGAFEHFPTAAAAVLTVDLSDWSAIAYGTARFVDFAKPRELVAD